MTTRPRATWWSAEDAEDTIPAGPGAVTAHLFAGTEYLSADVAVRVHAVDIGQTVASIELVAANVEGGRPGRSILAELTAHDAAMLGAALLAAAGLTRASDNAAGLADSLRPLDATDEDLAATPDPDSAPCPLCGGGLRHFPECPVMAGRIPKEDPR